MTTPVHIVSKKPIHNLKELREITTRASGSTAAYLKALDAPTTYVGIGDVYDAMQKGQIDATISGGAANAVSRGYAALAKNIVVDPPITNPAVACYILRLKLWNSLPEDLQQILISATNENSQHISNEHVRREIFALEKLRKEGGKFTSFPAEDRAHMTKVAFGKWLNEYASKSDRAKKASDMLQDWVKSLGYWQ
jgi:TRAP-type C4-dicarboxylate transport system substrate-binding protein